MKTDNAEILSRHHIAFIKKANTVCFRLVNGYQTIEIHDKLGAVLTIRADWQYRGYGNSAGVEREPVKAFDMIHTPSFTQEWLTLVSLLRQGDTLEVSWLADTNGYVKKAIFAGDSETESYTSLHLDQTKVIIHRGKTQLTFQIGLSVCPSNSARMFQYA